MLFVFLLVYLQSFKLVIDSHHVKLRLSKTWTMLWFLPTTASTAGTFSKYNQSFHMESLQSKNSQN